MITILGPTASGKTSLATNLAMLLDGEILSADSRQVYRNMNIGTGKDLDDYTINGIKIPFHLIDIVDAGDEYNVYQYQEDFLKAYNDISAREKFPILCGGSGMYIESVLKAYKLVKVPENYKLRESLRNLNKAEMIAMLAKEQKLHNVSDTESKDRLLRAIEISDYYKKHPNLYTGFPKIDTAVFGISFNRKDIRQRITDRLQERLDEGMVDEIKSLLDSGITAEQLKYYGLEYKFLTQYATDEIEYHEMFELLNTAIHQFAKRQMTWYRRMEKNGTKIHWIDGSLPMENKIGGIMQIISSRFK